MSNVVGPKTPVTICQLEAEFNAALDLYREEKPLRVLEIGTASGGTLYHWLQNAEEGAHVVTVDLAEPDYESSEHLYPEWTPDGASVVQIRGDSHDPKVQADVQEHGPFDWLFIDGCHVYEDAKADWDDYTAMCTEGAMVLLHDIALRRRYDTRKTAGVWLLWRQIQAQGFWTRELRAEPGLDTYGIGVVRL